jgi:two-component system, NtrC family, nitrogen regulation sensor histidine kinase NtrY
VMIEDLTEIVKINKIKTWQEAAKQMAHEIKNPLTPIQLATQRLQRRFGAVLSNDPAFFDCTTTILSQVRVIKDLVTHFSVFASMPSPVIEIVDMSALIREIVCLYQLSYPTISLVVHMDPEQITVKTDKNKIRLVLINLLDNSIRVLMQHVDKADKQIVIRLYIDKSAAKVHLVFADNGPGIAQSVRDTLFLPYVSTEKKNMGLGLAIVRDTVVQLGGTVTLDSVSDGATFRIILPL